MSTKGIIQSKLNNIISDKIVEMKNSEQFKSLVEVKKQEYLKRKNLNALYDQCLAQDNEVTMLRKRLSEAENAAKTLTNKFFEIGNEEDISFFKYHCYPSNVQNIVNAYAVDQALKSDDSLAIEISNLKKTRANIMIAFAFATTSKQVNEVIDNILSKLGLSTKDLLQ